MRFTQNPSINRINDVVIPLLDVTHLFHRIVSLGCLTLVGFLIWDQIRQNECHTK